MPELTPQDALRLQEEGRATIADLRNPIEFAKGHPRYAISVPFSERNLAPRTALVAVPGTSIVLLHSDPIRLVRAVQQLELAGKPPLAGTLRGGWAEWQQAGLPTQKLDEVSIDDLSRRLTEKDKPTVVDVRERMEWETGHVPGATLIALGELRKRIGELDKARPVLVICESGNRSSMGASVLQAAGFSHVANVTEGTGEYRNRGLPLEFPKE